MNCWRKANDIPWMLLTARRQSVVVLTLLSWTMVGIVLLQWEDK